jgi:hypothetical protein
VNRARFAVGLPLGAYLGYVGSAQVLRAIEYLLAVQLVDVLGATHLALLRGAIAIVAAAMTVVLVTWGVPGRASESARRTLAQRVNVVTFAATLVFAALTLILIATPNRGSWPPGWRHHAAEKIVVAPANAQLVSTARLDPTFAPTTPRLFTVPGFRRAYLPLRRGDTIVARAAPSATLTWLRHNPDRAWPDDHTPRSDWGEVLATTPVGAGGEARFTATSSAWYALDFAPGPSAVADDDLDPIVGVQLTLTR